jgi:hypothetical protein
MKLSFVLPFVAAAFCSATIASPSRAANDKAPGADDAAATHLARLNKKALAQLQSRQFDAAKETLLEALVLGKESGLAQSPSMVRTYVELAALYLGAEKSRDKAVNQLLMALTIDRDFVLPKDLESPSLKSAYLMARRQAGAAQAGAMEGAQARPAAKPSEPPAAAVATEETAAASANQEPTTVTRRGRGGHAITVAVADPDPPARVPAPLFCPLPFEIPPGEPMIVRCLTQKQPKKSTAVLHYRAEGAASEEFVVVPMSRSPKGWLQATIPGDAIKSKSLAYYIQARVSDQILTLGRPDAPSSFLVKEGADASFDPDRENILDRLNLATADEEDTFHYHRRQAGAIWFSLAGGSGAAYHGTEAVDTGDRASDGTPIRSLAGFTGAGLLQTELEVGYQWTKRLSVSLMGRYQVAPSNSSGYTGTAIRTQALAGYLRARYAFLTLGNFQAHGSAGLGGGTNFLVVVGKQCDADNPTATCRLTHSDTLHGGPLGVLVGLGAAYHVSRNIAIVVDVNEIGTLPKFMALTEVNLGLAFAFGTETNSAATDDGVVSDKPSDADVSSAPPGSP